MPMVAQMGVCTVLLTANDSSNSQKPGMTFDFASLRPVGVSMNRGRGCLTGFL